MSRFYDMTVTVSGVGPERLEAVKEAAQSCWDFDDWEPLPTELEQPGESSWVSSGNGSLCGGETDDEFATRLATEIWTANGSFCHVDVTATYIEELPRTRYCFNEDDFAQVTAQPQTATDDSPPSGEPRCP